MMEPMETEEELRLRHKREWLDSRALLQEAIEQEDADKAKLAKLLAETLKIRQECERKVWGIQDKTDTGAENAFVLQWRPPQKDWLDE